MNDWERRPLGDIALWRGGLTPSMARPEFWDGGEIPWITSKEVVDGVLASTERRVTRAALSETSLRLIPAGSVAVVVRSGILAHTLPVALVPFDATVNQDVKIGTPGPGVSSEYLCLALQASERRILDGLRKSGTTVQSVDVPGLMRFEVPMPPLHEQRRIVDLIGALDAQIEALGAEHSAAISLWACLRDFYFLGSADDRRQFREVVTLQRGYDLPVQDRRVGPVPVVASNGLVGKHDTSMVTGPGVVTGRSGTIGKVMFIHGNFWPLNTTLFVKDFHGNDRRFVRHLLTSMRLEAHAGGSTVPSLNRNVLDRVEVYVPNLSMQVRIASELDALDDLTLAIAAERDDLRALRLRLTSAILTEQVEIPESYDALLEAV